MFVKNAQAQALLPSREWTNTDGKKLRAELLVFGKESEQGLVRLRMKNGTVHKVEESSLSRIDRALILKEQLKAQYRSDFNTRMDAYFYYAKKIPAKEEEDRTIAYVGNDLKGAWIRLKANLKGGIGKDGLALMIMGVGAPPIRIEYTAEDIEFFRGGAQLDLSLTKHNEALGTFLKDSEKMKFLIEDADKNYREIPLNDNEISALSQVSATFEKFRDLTSDTTWWATFKGIDPALLVKQEAEKETPPIPQPIPEIPKPLSEIVTWEIKATGEKFDAALKTFDRKKAIFQNDPTDAATARELLAADLIFENREVLTALRIKNSLTEIRHPIDDRLNCYWPAIADKAHDRTGQNLILFAVDRETEKPRLFLQQRYETPPSNRPVSARIRGKVLELDLPFELNGDTMKVRDASNTRVYFALPEDFCDVLLVATPALEGFQFSHKLNDGTETTGEFTEAEFKASIEAIEIFRLWHSLVKTEKSP
ncbi:hypothetical protein OAK43_01375 [Verrucomicrobiales bacterium]|nr:hypothetical protein [Verrucomicrobiales bacterium]